MATQVEQWCLAIDGNVWGPYSREEVCTVLQSRVRALPYDKLVALGTHPWGSVQVTSGDEWRLVNDCPAFSGAVEAIVAEELGRRSRKLPRRWMLSN